MVVQKLAGGSQAAFSGAQVTAARRSVPEVAVTCLSVGVQTDSNSFRSRPAVKHVAVDTKGMILPLALLEAVFRFWRMHGWRLCGFRSKGVEPTYPFELFLQQPLVVKYALGVWLTEEGFLLPDAAMVSPWLAWWFRDPEDRTPEEESQFVDQMCNVVRDLARTR
jgi:hypothetical protein